MTNMMQNSERMSGANVSGWEQTRTLLREAAGSPRAYVVVRRALLEALGAYDEMLLEFAVGAMEQREMSATRREPQEVDADVDAAASEEAMAPVDVVAAVAEVVAAPRPVVEVTGDTLRSLQQRLSGGKALADSHAYERSLKRRAESFSTLVERLGRPGPMASISDVSRELAALEWSMGEDALGSWSSLSVKQFEVVAPATVARARCVQDEARALGLGWMVEDAVVEGFGRVHEAREGRFVFGLRVDHTPRHGATWRHDADALARRCKRLEGTTSKARKLKPAEETLRRLEPLFARAASAHVLQDALVDALERSTLTDDDVRLVKMCAPRRDALDGSKKLQGLRAAVDASLASPPASEEPTEYALGGVFEGTHAMVLGGDSRPKAADAMCRTFGFSEVEWIELGHDGKRRHVQAASARVRNGSVDVVVYLKRYCSHSEGDRVLEAARFAGTPVAFVDQGYGVTQVGLALERAMGVGAGEEE